MSQTYPISIFPNRCCFKKVFGEYVSVYNFRESVDDKNTVPFFHEIESPKSTAAARCLRRNVPPKTFVFAQLSAMLETESGVVLK